MGVNVVQIVFGQALNTGTDLDGILEEVIHAFLEQLVVSVLDQLLLQ